MYVYAKKRTLPLGTFTGSTGSTDTQLRIVSFQIVFNLMHRIKAKQINRWIRPNGQIRMNFNAYRDTGTDRHRQSQVDAIKMLSQLFVRKKKQKKNVNSPIPERENRECLEFAWEIGRLALPSPKNCYRCEMTESTPREHSHTHKIKCIGECERARKVSE